MLGRVIIACGHHQVGLAHLVQATEPAGVERRLAQLLFILPDLRRLTAARAGFAVAGDDDTLSVQSSSTTEPLMQGRQYMQPALASLFRRADNASSRIGKSEGYL